jgi:plasmid replication initiation protein
MDFDSQLASIKAGIEKRTGKPNKVADDERHELTENSATKSNALCRAYYRYPIVTKRCMEALISMIDSRVANTEQLQFLELKATDYASAYNVDEKLAYRDIESAATQLVSKVLTVEEDGNRVDYTLMSRVAYQKAEGKIVATFNPLVAKHLVRLQERFASYPLNQAVNFKSTYAWRIYELMVSWSQNPKDTGGKLAGWFTIEVDELRRIVAFPETQNFGTFKARVIERAQEELHREANIILQVTYIKNGRRFTHLKFEFIEDEQQKLDL